MTKKIKKNIIRIIISGILLGIAFILTERFGKWIGLIGFLLSYGVIAYDVIIDSVLTISHGHVFDENFLMMIATVGAFFCGEFSEGVAVMLFFQIGECFQTYAVNKSRKSIKALMNIRPDFARIISEDFEKEVDPEAVKTGDIILIKPGERIPLDGIVIEGTTTVDTSAITGESLPRDMAVNDTVVSGCVNLSGLIKVRVISEFANSTVSKVLSLVEDASSKKAKSEEFITIFARYYTPIIVGCAASLSIIGSIVTGDIKTWLYRAMTFLLISCPCALVISIPLSFFGGIGGASRHGILIKGGNYMDALAKINTLVLDKTGTITKGNFKVSLIECSDSFKENYKEKAEDKLLEIAAYAESFSTHPIALSIENAYKGPLYKEKISDVTEIAGKGVKALIDGTVYYVGNKKLMEDVLDATEMSETDLCNFKKSGGTLVFVAKDKHLLGHVHITDEIKPLAKEALENAKKSGIKKIIMLTGDNSETAKVVAEAVKVDEFRADLNPLDKVSEIEKLLNKEAGVTLAFVGDGINDAPVLARADIGIAMGAMGSDAAIEAADVVIMNDDLSKIPEAKGIAKKTLRIVKENIVFALGIKLLVLILAAFGIAHMGAAIFADVGVAFVCIINAMRALK